MTNGKLIVDEGRRLVGEHREILERGEKLWPIEGRTAGRDWLPVGFQGIRDVTVSEEGFFRLRKNREDLQYGDDDLTGDLWAYLEARIKWCEQTRIWIGNLLEEEGGPGATARERFGRIVKMWGQKEGLGRAYRDFVKLLDRGYAILEEHGRGDNLKEHCKRTAGGWAENDKKPTKKQSEAEEARRETNISGPVIDLPEVEALWREWPEAYRDDDGVELPARVFAGAAREIIKQGLENPLNERNWVFLHHNDGGHKGENPFLKHILCRLLLASDWLNERLKKHLDDAVWRKLGIANKRQRAEAYKIMEASGHRPEMNQAIPWAWLAILRMFKSEVRAKFDPDDYVGLFDGGTLNLAIQGMIGYITRFGWAVRRYDPESEADRFSPGMEGDFEVVARGFVTPWVFRIFGESLMAAIEQLEAETAVGSEMSSSPGESEVEPKKNKISSSQSNERIESEPGNIPPKYLSKAMSYNQAALKIGVKPEKIRKHIEQNPSHVLHLSTVKHCFDTRVGLFNKLPT